jgi:hydroxymethylbilane synthase
VASVDGKEAVEIERDGDAQSIQDAESFGKDAALEIAAKGAGKILEVIQQHKKKW